jgi:hypothetical protein
MKEIIILAAVILAVSPLSASTVIVDLTTRNGGFESGSLSPWSGGSTVFDPAGAASGSWYAKTTATVNRASLFLFFPSVTTDYAEFTLSFSARTDTVGFLTASGYLYARRSDSSFVNAVVIDSSTNALSDGWQQYTRTFRFEELWDTSQNMSVGVNFNGGSAGVSGYLDNVALAQIPEPTTTVFFLIAIPLLSIRRRTGKCLIEQDAPSNR